MLSEPNQRVFAYFIHIPILYLVSQVELPNFMSKNVIFCGCLLALFCYEFSLSQITYITDQRSMFISTYDNLTVVISRNT